MTNEESPLNSSSETRRTSNFSLTTLFGVLTICAILLAWFVDHRRLSEQIPSPPKKQTISYRLTHVSGDLVTQKLSELFESETIVHETITNTLIVSAERANQERIHMILRYMDRQGTDFVEAKTRVSELKDDRPTTQIE